MATSAVEFKDMEQAQAWVQAQVPRIKRPTVVLLSGPLGAGKTQFVRWFLAEFKVNEVASPTFAVVNEYQTPNGTIDHVDLYRVKDDSDLDSAGFWDLFDQPRGLVFVEWADRLPNDVWPKHWQQFYLELSRGDDAEARRLSFELKPPATKSVPGR